VISNFTSPSLRSFSLSPLDCPTPQNLAFHEGICLPQSSQLRCASPSSMSAHTTAPSSPSNANHILKMLLSPDRYQAGSGSPTLTPSRTSSSGTSTARYDTNTGFDLGLRIKPRRVCAIQARAGLGTEGVWSGCADFVGSLHTTIPQPQCKLQLNADSERAGEQIQGQDEAVLELRGGL